MKWGDTGMFGYIRPLVDDMKVRENEMYRAIYCGLCRAMGHHTGCASRMTLSYDFVFLSAFRAAITGVRFDPQPHRCIMHPVKRRMMAEDNEIFAYCARAAAYLTYAKLEDDLADESGARRLAAKSLRPAAADMRKKAGALPELEASIASSLEALRKLEAAESDSIDETAECFGQLLSDIFAHGLTGTDARIAREVGRAVGRFIYVIDAADDAPEDGKKNRYNPILRRYGQDILVEREYTDRAGNTKTAVRIDENTAQDLYIAALNDLSRLSAAIELMDFTRAGCEVEGIVKNTVYLGMPAELRRVLAIDESL